MNVLLTCGGARAYLLGTIRAALEAGGMVITCDASPDAPAMCFADRAYVVPKVTEPAYLPELLAICRDERVDLLVPSLEAELELLAARRDEFASVGTFVLVSSPQVIDTCNDKLASEAFLASCGVAAPRTWTSLEAARASLARGELVFPVVVKPRWGTTSIGLTLADDDDELAMGWRIARRAVEASHLRFASARDPTRAVLFQEYVAGQEYGFDVVNDLAGRYMATFVRRKLRMRAGQTDRAETVPPGEFESVARRIGERLGHIGMLDCDAIVGESGCIVLDMNPRVGGGYPFSHLSGANFWAALIAWVRGEEPDPAWKNATPHITAARYDHYHTPVSIR